MGFNPFTRDPSPGIHLSLRCSSSPYHFTQDITERRVVVNPEVQKVEDRAIEFFKSVYGPVFDEVKVRPFPGAT
jgi:hypothetical protein